jgi:hypothetical protein
MVHILSSLLQLSEVNVGRTGEANAQHKCQLPCSEDFEDAAFSLVWDAFPSFMFMFGMAGRLYCTVGVHPTRCKVCSLLTISTKAIGFIEQTGGLFSL